MYTKKRVGTGLSRFDFGLNWNFLFGLHWEFKKQKTDTHLTKIKIELEPMVQFGLASACLNDSLKRFRLTA